MRGIYYRVKLAGKDITPHVTRMTFGTEVNSFSTGTVIISNPNYKYTKEPETVETYGRSQIEIWCKEREEDEWVQMVDGVITTPRASFPAGDDNSTVELRFVGGRGLNKTMLTPNAITTRSAKEIKSVFVGHPYHSYTPTTIMIEDGSGYASWSSADDGDNYVVFPPDGTSTLNAPPEGWDFAEYETIYLGVRLDGGGYHIRLEQEDGGGTFDLIPGTNYVSKIKEEFGGSAKVDTIEVYRDASTEVKVSRIAAMNGPPENPEDVSWDTDAHDNYPDGILYKTGYKYSPESIVELFEHQRDLPHSYKHPDRKTFGTIRDICELYGLVFYIDDINKELIVMKDPQTVEDEVEKFPIHDFHIKYGVNVNSLNDEIDEREHYDKVTVVGPTYQWTEGNGPKEYIHHDEELVGAESVIAKAKELAARMIVRADTPLFHNTTVRIPGTVEPLMMKRVKVSDHRIGMEERYRNVVGVEHEIMSDRWTTTLVFENQRFSTGRVLAEILEELEEEEDEPLIGTAFLAATPEFTLGITASNIGGFCVLEESDGDADWTTANIKRATGTVLTDTHQYGSYSVNSGEYSDVIHRFGVITNTREKPGDVNIEQRDFDVEYIDPGDREIAQYNDAFWIRIDDPDGEPARQLPVFTSRINEIVVREDAPESDFHKKLGLRDATEVLVAKTDLSTLPAPASDDWTEKDGPVAFVSPDSNYLGILSDFTGSGIVLEDGELNMLKVGHELDIHTPILRGVREIGIVLITKGADVGDITARVYNHGSPGWGTPLTNVTREEWNVGVEGYHIWQMKTAPGDYGDLRTYFSSDGHFDYIIEYTDDNNALIAHAFAYFVIDKDWYFADKHPAVLEQAFVKEAWVERTGIWAYYDPYLCKVIEFSVWEAHFRVMVSNDIYGPMGAAVFREAIRDKDTREFKDPDDRWEEAEETMTIEDSRTIRFSVTGGGRPMLEELVNSYTRPFGHPAFDPPAKPLYIAYHHEVRKRYTMPDPDTVPRDSIWLVPDPDSLGHHEVWLRLDRHLPPPGAPLLFDVDSVGTELAAMVEFAPESRIDQGIDMGVPKTIRLSVEVDKNG